MGNSPDSGLYHLNYIKTQQQSSPWFIAKEESLGSARLPRDIPEGWKNLTNTVRVLPCELMLALVRASGPEQARARSLIKGWSGMRTPTSYREGEEL